jgi:hypothetical protein
VGIVTVAAGDPFGEHAALQERAVFVDLSLHLPVGVVEVVVQQRDAVVVAHRLAMHHVLVHQPASRVTAGAHVDLA